MRLDRFICNATALSRSQAQREIRAGRVSVDGVTTKRAATSVPLTASVSLAGERVAPPLPRYLMLHKPLGVVCATRDPTHRTAIGLLDLPNPEGLHFAGRLDIDTTGLVLISDDGQWTHRIVSPGHRCTKRYRVGLAEAPDKSQLRQLCEGILLKGEQRPTRPARVEWVDQREILLSITEGRYHQVKRMLAALGHSVVRLHREAIGPLELDPGLGPGAFRPLRAEEVALF
ncbi:MAG: pseudouridine synthase [Candidatus Thiodiazotropha sp.]